MIPFYHENGATHHTLYNLCVCYYYLAVTRGTQSRILVGYIILPNGLHSELTQTVLRRNCLYYVGILASRLSNEKQVLGFPCPYSL